jgi:hypothetical protein
MFVDVADYEAIAAVATALSARAVVLGDQGRSVGPWTPAIAGDFTWAVLGLQGQPIYLAHDAFTVARVFCQLEAGEVDEDALFPGLAPPDSFLVARERYESWAYEYRFSRCGDPTFEPPFPQLDYGAA